MFPERLCGYTAFVDFHLESSVNDAIAGGSPLTDRLRSYLHFADAAIVEQSTWDEFGSGRSLLGLRAGTATRAPLVLAVPLPEDPTGLAGPEDRGRAVHLLAATALFSDTVFPGDGRPVALAAWRPDPLAASLREILGPLGGPPSIAVVHSPEGPLPAPVTRGVVVVALESEIRGAPRLPRLHDIVSVVPATSLARPGAVPDSAFPSLLAAIARGDAIPLDLHLVPGTDFQAPRILSADLGLPRGHAVLPSDWRVSDTSPTDVGRFDAGLAEAIGALARPWFAIQALFRRASHDLGAQEPFPRLLNVASAIDHVRTHVALPVRLRSPRQADRLRDALETLLSNRPGNWPDTVWGRVALWAPVIVADPGSLNGTDWTGPGTSIAAFSDAVFAIGPDPAIIVSEPAAAARGLLDAMRRCIASDASSTRPSP